MQSGILDEGRNKLINPAPLASKPFIQGQGNQQVGINIGSNHAYYLRDTFIWSSFPLGERTYISMKNLARCKPKSTYVDYIDTEKPITMQSEIDKLRNQAVRINILETSQLELDRYVIHPFVKLHVVDIHTGRYLSKSDQKCVVGLNEGITTMNAQKSFVESGLDYIPPFATNCCDLRVEGIARARWNYSNILLLTVII